MAAPGGSPFERELAYHERLYSGFAQSHFGRPAVRNFRQHLIARIVGLLRLDRGSVVVSLGCGIGDTELLLAPHVGRICGVELSPTGVRQARADASRQEITNVEFREGSFEDVPDLSTADAVIAIFFLHHLPDASLAAAPARIRQMLKSTGSFYSLDPSSHRLSGKVGRLLIPWMMKRYQTEDERELEPDATAGLFRQAGFTVRHGGYDFGSTPMAGLFPGWGFGYRAARRIDDGLLKAGALRRWGSNFEIIAHV